jgi:hypothetical protein
MKRSGVCPKCQGQRVGRITHVVDDGPAGKRQLVQMRGWIRSNAGDVEAYVCTDCGYFEEHVAHSDLRTLAWEKVEGFEWHSAPSGGSGPFR